MAKRSVLNDEAVLRSRKGVRCLFRGREGGELVGGVYGCTDLTCVEGRDGTCWKQEQMGCEDPATSVCVMGRCSDRESEKRSSIRPNLELLAPSFPSPAVREAHLPMAIIDPAANCTHREPSATERGGAQRRGARREARRSDGRPILHTFTPMDALRAAQQGTGQFKPPNPSHRRQRDHCRPRPRRCRTPNLDWRADPPLLSPQ